MATAKKKEVQKATPKAKAKATEPKTLSNVTEEGAKEVVSDIVFAGKENSWRTLCKAFSKKEGWMKSTKAMQLKDNKVLIQTSTQQLNGDGSYSLSDTLISIDGNLHESTLEKGIFIIG